jgi:hypothetical protein
MTVGDPHFAAQLQTQEGQVLNFDDPGCLLRYLAAERPRVHALYFHHLTQDRWLAGSQVGFVPVPHSPMGYRLGAVEAKQAGALGLEAAQSRLADQGRMP